VDEVAIRSPKREVNGDSHSLYFEICDKWRRWPSPLKKEVYGAGHSLNFTDR